CAVVCCVRVHISFIVPVIFSGVENAGIFKSRKQAVKRAGTTSVVRLFERMKFETGVLKQDCFHLKAAFCKTAVEVIE
ncbi:MAG: hypothetical protein ABGX12_01090, partial [Desulfurobacteriaceae bacterium]